MGTSAKIHRPYIGRAKYSAAEPPLRCTENAVGVTHIRSGDSPRGRASKCDGDARQESAPKSGPFQISVPMSQGAIGVISAHGQIRGSYAHREKVSAEVEMFELAHRGAPAMTFRAIPLRVKLGNRNFPSPSYLGPLEALAAAGGNLSGGFKKNESFWG